MSLSDLLVFDTTEEVDECIKFFIICMHNNTLWLDKGYPIHVEDIHQLTWLSMDAQDVTDGFQGSRKHGHKKGTLTLYKKYNTQQGGWGALIELIKDEQIWCAYYIIA